MPFDPVFADPKRLALGGFLAGHNGLPRDAYQLDVRQYLASCDDLDLSQARRADIEEFDRELEPRGRARATVPRRLCTVTSFYRDAEDEGLPPALRAAVTWATSVVRRSPASPGGRDSTAAATAGEIKPEVR